MNPDIFQAIYIFVIVLFSVISHEVAHGFAAFKLGDPTARRMGRLTFNPLPHVDPLGSVILPLVLFFIGSPVLFAWAKPVPVNPLYFRHPKRGMMLVALAGPATNLLIALVLTGVMHGVGTSLPPSVQVAILTGIILNLALMVFNALPVPPLDGSRVVARFLSGEAYRAYVQIERYGMFIIIGLMYLGVIQRILIPAVAWAAQILGLEQFLEK